VFHFHHGSGEHADRSAEFVLALCRRLGVLCEIGRFDPARAPREGGPEARWRTARYAWFSARLDPEGVLLLAHHADDRLESLALALLRSAGTAGLVGMGRSGAMRPFGRGYLYRPLLDWTGAEIETYARARGLEWLEDPSNADPSHERNFLRRRVFAPLIERRPEAARLAGRSLDALAEDEERLAREDARIYATVVRGHVLEVGKLRVLSPAERRRVLRLWLVRHEGGFLPRTRFDLLEEAVSGRGSDRLEVRGEGAMRYILHGGGLYAVGELPPLPPEDWETGIDERGRASLPTGYGSLVLAGARLPARALVRFRRGGEFLPWGRSGTRLQEFLRRRGVPPWLRGRLPLLLVDGVVRAVGPWWIEERWRAEAAILEWLPESEALLQALFDVGKDPG
jgi:tRNA(Ile)-lysidine synthase